MWEKTCFNLLIFGGIFSQGILGTFLEDNYKNSSNHHFRTKRMIAHTIRGRGDWLINDVIHIVKILKDDIKVCTGIIVTPEHILTPGTCVFGLLSSYRVESGAPGRGPIKTHHINHIFYHKSLYLLLIGPSIPPESRLSRPILPAQEDLPEGLHPAIIAWAYTGQVRPIMDVEIVNLYDCSVIYQNHQNPYYITNENVCTMPAHEAHNRCLTRDRGSALVVGDRIFAVLDRAAHYDHTLPNVFILVNNGNEYYTWLMEYIQPYLNSHPHLYNLAP